MAADSEAKSLVVRFLEETAKTGEMENRLSALERRFPPQLVDPSELRQMILVRAWERQNEFRGATLAEFWSWLGRLGWSIGIDLWRERKKRRGLYARAAAFFKSVLPVASEDRARTAKLIEWLIAGLNARERKALQLKYFEGMSAQRAAKEMGVSREAFYQLHYRAIAKLRERIQQHKE